MPQASGALVNHYYGARELRGADGKGTGRWHYTVQRDGRTRPIGYCFVAEDAEPCPGHPSAEAAEEHYRIYLVDNATYGRELLPPGGCLACDCVTVYVVVVEGGTAYRLCAEHNTRAQLLRYVPRPGNVTSSH